MEIYIYGNKYYICEGNIRVECDNIADGIQRLEEAKKFPVRYEDDSAIEPIPHPYTIAQWVREYRNKLLAESDWVVLGDVPIDEKKRAEWMRYRQKLRDIPKEWGLPNNLNVFDTDIGIDISFIRRKEDVEKLPFPKKPN